ncbi:MAG: hypothetical protein ACI8QT_001840, partial [Halioglobus sp.]
MRKSSGVICIDTEGIIARNNESGSYLMKAKNQINLLGSLMLALPILATSAAAENPGGWEYSIAPLYVWGKSTEGKSAVGPTESELDLNVKDDLLENLDAAAAVHLDAKQGPLVFFGEYNYARLDPSTKINQGTFDYRFNDWGSFFAGYRHLDLDYANKSSDADNYATDTANSG